MHPETGSIINVIVTIEGCGDYKNNVPWDPREVERPYPLLHRPEQADLVRALSEQRPGTHICHNSPGGEQSPRQRNEETRLTAQTMRRS